MGGPPMTDKSETESRLLRRVRDGDEGALVVLFARNQDHRILPSVAPKELRPPSLMNRTCFSS
jgi:hypothetical protein